MFIYLLPLNKYSSTHQSVSVSIFIYIQLFICLSSLSTFFIYLSIYLSICLSIYLYCTAYLNLFTLSPNSHLRPSNHIAIYLSISIHPFTSISPLRQNPPPTFKHKANRAQVDAAGRWGRRPGEPHVNNHLSFSLPYYDLAQSSCVMHFCSTRLSAVIRG